MPSVPDNALNYQTLRKFKLLFKIKDSARNYWNFYKVRLSLQCRHKSRFWNLKYILLIRFPALTLSTIFFSIKAREFLALKVSQVTAPLQHLNSTDTIGFKKKKKHCKRYIKRLCKALCAVKKEMTYQAANRQFWIPRLPLCSVSNQAQVRHWQTNQSSQTWV